MQICNNEFKGILIETIIIPSHVNTIQEQTFCSCKNLCNIEFKNNSELALIGINAFQYSSIKTIIIPSQVTCMKN